MNETPPTQASENLDLPMTVWLTGEEDYFSEFTMDADAVMAQLQIKRSRLTQISGKELRVGRTRIDRYIRPVFRPQDIENYLNWSRAPATKQKSNAELSELQQQFEAKISEILSKAPQHISHNTALAKTSDSKALEHKIRTIHQKLCDQLQSLLNTSHRNLQQSLSPLRTEIQSIKKQLLTVEAIAQSIPHLLYELKNLQITMDTQKPSQQTRHKHITPRYKRYLNNKSPLESLRKKRFSRH
ncbi:MAG: hypothetical protein AB8C84_12790 [Oligoflexales bacterium]